MDGTGRLLQTQVPELSQAFDIRCLALSPTNHWSWPQLVEHSLSLLKTAIFHQPRPLVYLCGESFGACWALQLAVRAPRLFSHLVLVNPASSFQRLPWMQWGASLARGLPGPLYRFSNLGLIPFLMQSQRVAPAAREALLQAMTSVPAATALWRVSLLSQFQVGQLPLAQLTRPTLLIASEADGLLPSVEEAQRLAQQLPQSQLLTLPHSGHACLLEEAVSLYQLMTQAGFQPENGTQQ